MNRGVSFSVSCVAHVTCVGLLFLAAKPTSEKPIIVQAARVTLVSHTVSEPAPVPPKPTPKPPSPPRPQRKVTPTPRPRRDRIITKEIVRQKLPEPLEALPDLTRIEPVKPEPLAHVPTGSSARSEESSRALSANEASLLDAAIASFIKNNWSRPSLQAVGENPPPVSVDIRITKDGRIVLKGISRSSGNGILDRSAVKAIEMSARLPRHLLTFLSDKHYDVTIVFSITDEA